MVKISTNRLDMETKRLERALLKNYTETVVSVTASATTTLDISSGNIFNLSQAVDITGWTISNIPASGLACSITIIRRKDSTGTARAITWPASFKWAGGSSPTLGQTSDSVDIINAITINSGTTWYAFGSGSFVIPLPRFFTWGRNSNGELGLDNITDYSSPKQVGALTDWLSVAGGYHHSLAIKTDGTLWTWGQGSDGKLGHSNLSNQSSPKQVGALTTWSKIAGGNAYSVALKSDGTLWSWGQGGGGSIGLNNTTSYSSPKQVGVLTTWLTISSGYRHCLAIKTDGTLWSWGWNGYGQLGHGNTTSYSSPKQIGSLTNWLSVAGGYHHSLAIKTDGTLWSWGDNTSYGDLGLNNTTSYSSPKQVGALTDWLSIVGRYRHALAIKTDGSLWSWGRGISGQLGHGNSSNQSSPKQVGALTNWLIVAGTYTQTYAIKTDGTLWSWGAGSYGALGLGNTTSYSSPKQVGVLTTWSKIAGGGYQALGIG